MKENDLAHSEFGRWLESVNLNQSTANKMMKVLEELIENILTSPHFDSNALYEIATQYKAHKDVYRAFFCTKLV